jgi:hypothetical protein
MVSPINNTEHHKTNGIAYTKYLVFLRTVAYVGLLYPMAPYGLHPLWAILYNTLQYKGRPTLRQNKVTLLHLNSSFEK